LRATPKSKVTGIGKDQIFITARVKHIMDLSNEEANRMLDEYISTEHILLSILTERNTPAARILASAGLNQFRVYTVLKEIRKMNDLKVRRQKRRPQKINILVELGLPQIKKLQKRI
jgi:ATP-dependent Clp protease ATP-binding subunit ClpA